MRSLNLPKARAIKALGQSIADSEINGEMLYASVVFTIISMAIRRESIVRTRIDEKTLAFLTQKTGNCLFSSNPVFCFLFLSLQFFLFVFVKEFSSL